MFIITTHVLEKPTTSMLNLRVKAYNTTKRDKEVIYMKMGVNRYLEWLCFCMFYCTIYRLNQTIKILQNQQMFLFVQFIYQFFVVYALKCEHYPALLVYKRLVKRNWQQMSN